MRVFPIPVLLSVLAIASPISAASAADGPPGADAAAVERLSAERLHGWFKSTDGTRVEYHASVGDEVIMDKPLQVHGTAVEGGREVARDCLVMIGGKVILRTIVDPFMIVDTGDPSLSSPDPACPKGLRGMIRYDQIAVLLVMTPADQVREALVRAERHTINTSVFIHAADPRLDSPVHDVDLHPEIGDHPPVPSLDAPSVGDVPAWPGIRRWNDGR